MYKTQAHLLKKVLASLGQHMAVDCAIQILVLESLLLIISILVIKLPSLSRLMDMVMMLY